MGKDGETCTVVAPYPVTHGKSTEDYYNGRLYGATMDIEGVSVMANFEVIEIVDDSNPYPALLGID